jgi:hypothetical protein
MAGVGMPSRDLTLEDIADWLTPGQAVKILDAAFQKSYLSKQALLGRLAGGIAEAVSEQTDGHLLDHGRPHLSAPVIVRYGRGNRQPFCGAI